MRSFYYFLRRFGMVILGLVFFGSGMLKLMDPVGTTLIVDQYLGFLNLRALWAADRVIATAIAAGESLLGAMLLSGVWRKAAGIITGVVLIAFTILTARLVAKNPEWSCGCFGEALHLTHIQSLSKNIILCLLAIFVFVPAGGFYRFHKHKIVAFALGAAVIALFGVYSQLGMPLIDFTVYAPGAHLLDPAHGYEDTSRCPHLAITDSSDDYAGDLLMEGKSLTVSLYKPDKLKDKDWEFVTGAVSTALNAGVRPLVLVPVACELPDDLGEYMYRADYKDILTLNRSNGGLTYICDGEIVRKWARGHAGPLSEASQAGALSEVHGSGRSLSEALAGNPAPVRVRAVSAGRVRFEGLCLSTLALLLLI